MEAFQDLYFIARTVNDACDFGWPIHRERQYCIMVNREWFFERFMVPAGAQQLWDNEKFDRALCAQAVVDFALKRSCEYGWEAFLWSGDRVAEEELHWARTRKEVKARWKKAPKDKARLDKPNSPWAFMNVGERERYQAYIQRSYAKNA